MINHFFVDRFRHHVVINAKSPSLGRDDPFGCAARPVRSYPNDGLCLCFSPAIRGRLTTAVRNHPRTLTIKTKFVHKINLFLLRSGKRFQLFFNLG